MILNWGVGVGGLSFERVRCDTGTVTPDGKLQSILHVEHPQRAPPQKKTVRSRYVLELCLCQD